MISSFQRYQQWHPIIMINFTTCNHSNPIISNLVSTTLLNSPRRSKRKCPRDLINNIN
ncbi:hypothetical protein FWK35_00026510 [Aphis craccivora]|uniref:Uncharacterized protein n=1 Tax=Aphis craccivora TaxID=307492 RepID=A0A6G0Y4A4_APHCR|nr:hypothetical protein FWK35_00026510 [Aphis craccivora]